MFKQIQSAIHVFLNKSRQHHPTFQPLINLIQLLLHLHQQLRSLKPLASQRLLFFLRHHKIPSPQLKRYLLHKIACNCQDQSEPTTIRSTSLLTLLSPSLSLILKPWNDFWWPNLKDVPHHHTTALNSQSRKTYSTVYSYSLLEFQTESSLQIFRTPINQNQQVCPSKSTPSKPSQVPPKEATRGPADLILYS